MQNVNVNRQSPYASNDMSVGTDFHIWLKTTTASAIKLNNYLLYNKHKKNPLTEHNFI